jgi:hypothetical protein
MSETGETYATGATGGSEFEVLSSEFLELRTSNFGPRTSDLELPSVSAFLSVSHSELRTQNFFTRLLCSGSFEGDDV